MPKRALVAVTLSSWLAGCATTGAPDTYERGGTAVSLLGLAVAASAFSGSDGCLEGGSCPVIVEHPLGGLGLIAGGLLLGVIGVAIDAPPSGGDREKADTGLATNAHERRILRLAATGQCRSAVREYDALRARDLAAAGRLKLDDHLHTCIALEESRARGAFR